MGSAFYLSTDQGLYYWQESVLGERPAFSKPKSWLLNNPVHHSLLTLSPHSSIEKAEIYNLNGGLVWQKEKPENQEAVHLPKGFYILNILSEGKQYQEKLLVQN